MDFVMQGHGFQSAQQQGGVSSQSPARGGTYKAHSGSAAPGVMHPEYPRQTPSLFLSWMAAAGVLLAANLLFMASQGQGWLLPHGTAGSTRAMPRQRAADDGQGVVPRSWPGTAPALPLEGEGSGSISSSATHGELPFSTLLALLLERQLR